MVERGDFETEYENEAELLVADMEFTDTDDKYQRGTDKMRRDSKPDKWPPLPSKKYNEMKPVRTPRSNFRKAFSKKIFPVNVLHERLWEDFSLGLDF